MLYDLDLFDRDFSRDVNSITFATTSKEECIVDSAEFDLKAIFLDNNRIEDCFNVEHGIDPHLGDYEGIAYHDCIRNFEFRMKGN